MEELAFKIDCEWLCDFVRQRVYHEGQSFEWGIQTLLASFNGAITEEIAFQILTGVKKVVGVNEGILQDDDKLKDYLDYVKRKEKAERQAKVDQHVLSHPLNYVDPFATVYSVKAFKKIHEHDEYPVTMRELKEYFLQPPANDDLLFDGGLYSLKLATSIVEDTDRDKFSFYDALYSYWQKQLEREDYYYEPKDKEKIRQRQRSYEFWLQKRTTRDITSLLSKKGEEEARILSDREYEDKRREEYPHWVIRDDNTYNLCEGSESYYQRLSRYVPCDEGVFYRYGLIAPNGDFYACTFASHETAATILCVQNGYFGKPPQDMDEETWCRTMLLDARSVAKETLYDRGWVFVNSAFGFGGTFYSKWGELENMPQKQMDTAFDWDIWCRNESKF
ncbi:MAG: hypothetical protein NC218_02260 [Acetobacter sp.]|nr:hypothetical protein [Acetobacter sp.]